MSKIANLIAANAKKAVFFNVFDNTNEKVQFSRFKEKDAEGKPVFDKFTATLSGFNAAVTENNALVYDFKALNIPASNGKKERFEVALQLGATTDADKQRLYGAVWHNEGKDGAALSEGAPALRGAVGYKEGSTQVEYQIAIWNVAAKEGKKAYRSVKITEKQVNDAPAVPAGEAASFQDSDVPF